MHQDQRGPRQPSDPAQAEGLSSLSRIVDVEDALLITGEHSRDPRRKPRGRRQRAGGVWTVGGGAEIAACRFELARKQAHDSERKLAGGFRQLSRELLGRERVVGNGSTQEARPIIAGHRRGLQPAGQRLALGRTDQAGVARAEEPFGSLIGVDRLVPAAFSAMPASAPQHQPGILTQQRRRQGIDPGVGTMKELPTLVMQ